jgi:hypothetical protein
MADRTGDFYAAEGAIHGYGAQLLIGNGVSPEVFEAVAFLKNIQPGTMETADMLRTHLRSPDAHQEHMPGLRDSGAFVCSGIWVPTEESLSNEGGGTGPFQNGGVIALWRARTVHNMKIILNDEDETEWPFRGYVRRFQPGDINNDAPIDFTIEFMPTQAYDAALP